MKSTPAQEEVNAALNSPSVAQETEDVTLMDKLLSTVREFRVIVAVVYLVMTRIIGRSSNPAFHSCVRLRVIRIY